MEKFYSEVLRGLYPASPSGAILLTTSQQKIGYQNIVRLAKQDGGGGARL